MPVETEQKTETSTVKSDTFGLNVVPPAVTEVLKKIREESAGQTNSIIEKEADESAKAGEVKEKTQESQPEKPLETVVEEGKTPAGESYEEIDPKLVSAARTLGWSDEKIEAVASQDISVLEDIARMRTILAEPEPEKKGEEDVTKSEVSKVVLDKDALDSLATAYGADVVDKVIKPLADTLNATIDRLGRTEKSLDGITGRFSEQDERDKQQQNLARFNSANKFFDDQSKDYPELGLFEKMPKESNGKFKMSSPEFKARSQIYEKAEIFRNAGYNSDSALKEAMVWYKGLGGEAKIEQKLVTEINDRKKKFIARPTQKKVDRKELTPNEAAAAIVQEAKRKAGFTG